MFDIGFSEIIVCAVVALVVIGPERMPETVRTVGLWIGRLKRSLRETRVEIERQIGVDDIRRQLHNEDIMRSLADVQKNITEALQQAQLDADEEERNKTRTYEHEIALPDHAHLSDIQQLNTNAPEHTLIEKNSPQDITPTSAPDNFSTATIAPTDTKATL